MLSETTSTNVETTTTETTKYYSSGNTNIIAKGCVILCQHGFQGGEGTMLPLFNNLRANLLSQLYRCRYCDNVLDYTTLSPDCDAILEIERLLSSNPERNVFVRTLFSNPKYGDVRTQSNELREMISLVKRKVPDAPIITVGYSKGGVVNCKCAIDNPGLIDKIVNIASPHTDTLAQDLVHIIGDALVERFGSLGGIPIIPVRNAIIKLVQLVDDGVDTLMDGPISYKDLKKEWNRASNRPKFTVIAGDAIEVNGEFEGDFVVPDYSAKAVDFLGRTKTFVIDDEKVTITTAQLRKAMGDFSGILDILSAFSQAILDVDVVKIMEALIDIFANIVQNDGDLFKCHKLAHFKLFNDDYILTHKKVGNKVFEGINA